MRALLVLEDGTYFVLRMSANILNTLSKNWGDFCELKKDERKLVTETISEQDDTRFPMARYYATKFEDDNNDRDHPKQNIDDDEIPF